MRAFTSALPSIIVAIILVTAFFGVMPAVAKEIDKWYVVSISMACCVGLVNLTNVHVRNVSRRGKDWEISVMLLTLMYGMLILGLVTGPLGKTYDWIFQVTVVPLGATFYALLAFYIVSAAYRAFRVKTTDAAILLGAAILVLIGRAPLGAVIWPGFETITGWIMDVPNTSAARAVALGGFLGAIITAIRVALGLERPHLGAAE